LTLLSLTVHTVLRCTRRRETRLARFEVGSLRHGVLFLGSEQKREPEQNFAQSCRTEDTDALAEAAPIDGSKLRYVHDAGNREPSFAPAEANVPRHVCEPKVGCHDGDHRRRDRAAVETVVLHHQGRAAACRLRTFRSAEV
jgi:hypothetical protein